MSPAASNNSRIASLDQFRGYTVAGMCLVNFLAPFLGAPAQLKHNESWFSYADSIMPSFFFAVGYSFRLTYLRRRTTTTWFQTAKTYLRRSLVLFGLSFAIYALTVDWTRWGDSEKMPPEFEAARAMPTRSFEPLLQRARQSAPEQSPMTLLESAERMSAFVKSGKPRNPASQADYEAAQSALRLSEAETGEFLAPAIERVRAWHSLDRTGRMLVRGRIQMGRLFKAELWETLAMIAAAQLLVLPWIGFGPRVRFAVLGVYGLLHAGLCVWFNWDFVYGINHNWMSTLWRTGDARSWDGGVFGPPCWAIAILTGTLAYDLAQASPSLGASAGRLFLFGCGFMLFGYGLACVSRLYDLNGQELTSIRERRAQHYAEQAWIDRLIERYQQRLRREARLQTHGNPNDSNATATADRREELEARIAVLDDQRDAYPDLDLAPHPFLPAWEGASDRPLADLFAEPPFMATPRDDTQSAGTPAVEHRLWNYWMLGKRVPTLSFMTLASGFACVLYSLFVVACDGYGLALGVFRTFGTNALVAYFTHGMIELSVWIFVPSTVAFPIALSAFVVFFTLTWALVRQLEKRGIYIKL